MLNLSRRSLLRSAGLLTAGSALALKPLASVAATSCNNPPPGTPSIASGSICVFFDGLWALRADEKTGTIVAITDDPPAYPGAHVYRQGIYDSQKGASGSYSKFSAGNYSITKTGGSKTAGSPSALLRGKKQFLPYIGGVYSDSTSTAQRPQLRTVTLPVPDALHPAALIPFQSSDFEGDDSKDQSVFAPPDWCPTVMIFEYVSAVALTIAPASYGATPILPVTGDQHLHFQVSPYDSCMSPNDEECHIQDCSENLAGYFQDIRPASFDFWLDPSDLASVEDRITAGIAGVSCDELGMIGHLCPRVPAQKTDGAKASRNQGPKMLGGTHLAHCAGAIIGGGQP